MKFCNDCAVPESSKCDTVECPPACNGSEQSCPCFNFDCFKAGKIVNLNDQTRDPMPTENRRLVRVSNRTRTKPYEISQYNVWQPLFIKS